MTISYSAPGKIILSGEHSVVYGKPAVVSAVNRRLTFEILEKKEKIKDKAIIFISEKIKNFLKEKKIKFDNEEPSYKIISSIPIGRGLGSSAALSLAASAAFLEFYTGKKFSLQNINNLASEVEKYFHKNSSGVDVAASCFGGLIFYRREFDFLKTISTLSINITKKISDSLFLIDSGKPDESTGEMVKKVNLLYSKKHELISSIFNQVEIITKKMVTALAEEDNNNFVRCIIDNEILLEMIDVVSTKTKKLLDKLSNFGVGKITGAGGTNTNSGFILFYSDRKKELINYLNKNKIIYLKFNQDSKGLQ